MSKLLEENRSLTFTRTQAVSHQRPGNTGALVARTSKRPERPHTETQTLQKKPKKCSASLVTPRTEQSRTIALPSAKSRTRQSDCPRCAFTTQCLTCYSCARCGWEMEQVLGTPPLWLPGKCRCGATVWLPLELTCKTTRLTSLARRSCFRTFLDHIAHNCKHRERTLDRCA